MNYDYPNTIFVQVDDEGYATLLPETVSSLLAANDAAYGMYVRVAELDLSPRQARKIASLQEGEPCVIRILQNGTVRITV